MPRLAAPLAALALALGISGPSAAGPLGAHSMLYVDSPPAFKEAMFREAAWMHASWIRVDVAVPSVVVGSQGERDWSGLDEYAVLARRYHLRVLGVLVGTPWWLASCPPGTSAPEFYRCPPSDLAEWASNVGDIARHAGSSIDHWEVLNEPDGAWAFHGSAAQYGEMLVAASNVIKQANPSATVVLGGTMGPGSRAWLAEALSVPGTAAAFDVASLHVRCKLDRVRGQIRRWRRFFAGVGFRGPLWVTEHGYPSDPAQQFDPAFRGGEVGQADYLVHSVPALLSAGARVVFVTERDNLGGMFASEGVLGGTVADPAPAVPQIVRKRAARRLRGWVQSLGGPVRRVAV